MTEACSTRVEDAIDAAAARLAGAGVHFGHGADDAYGDAIMLLAGASGLALDALMGDAGRALDAATLERLDALVDVRIRTRRPAAYLIGRAWFAGLEFEVDESVLVPRSPLAEFLADGGSPWLDPEAVTRVLDLGTGSGCIAVAAALAFPNARVDAADVCPRALALAARNIARHVPDGRARAVRSDHFDGLAGERYDLIVSNPPYVPEARVDALPPEYRHEPRLGLAAGADGLDSVRAILHDAAAHLRPGGVLVVEVGESDEAVAEAFPKLPFTWLEFEHGGEGVFLLTREALAPAHGC